MRFKLEITNEETRHYHYRREALAYIAQRQARGALGEGATITDTKTGTIMQVKAPQCENYSIAY